MPHENRIVDPFDGKIKLTAIQTSQSVADQKGQEVSKGFAYPKTLAESPEIANSDDARRNQEAKPYIKTDTDVGGRTKRQAQYLCRSAWRYAGLNCPKEWGELA
ncbi:MAG: hypothetical protein U1F13_05900 [Acinetobacter parvus]